MTRCRCSWCSWRARIARWWAAPRMAQVCPDCFNAGCERCAGLGVLDGERWWHWPAVSLAVVVVAVVAGWWWA